MRLTLNPQQLRDRFSQKYVTSFLYSLPKTWLRWETAVYFSPVKALSGKVACGGGDASFCFFPFGNLASLDKTKATKSI